MLSGKTQHGTQRLLSAVSSSQVSPLAPPSPPKKGERGSQARNFWSGNGTSRFSPLAPDRQLSGGYGRAAPDRTSNPMKKMDSRALTTWSARPGSRVQL